VLATLRPHEGPHSKLGFYSRVLPEGADVTQYWRNPVEVGVAEDDVDILGVMNPDVTPGRPERTPENGSSEGPRLLPKAQLPRRRHVKLTILSPRYLSSTTLDKQ
jgi:hypothetical protein